MKRLLLILALLCSSFAGAPPSSDGCTIDGPALSPAASQATTAKRARLGASDDLGTITL